MFGCLKHKQIYLAFSAMLVAYLFSSSVLTATPYEFSYTGRLVDDTGKPYENTIALKVSFFHSPTATTPVMEITSGLGAVALQEGVFQISLSLDPADYQTIFPSVSQAVYLQITDLTHSKSYDRQKISMLPYAGKVPTDSDVFSYNNDGELTLSSTPQDGKYLKGNADGSVSWDSPAGGVAATSTDTFTNKTINADNNTITNIADTNIKAGAAIADTKLATIATAGKVSGAAITSGTIAGSTAVSTTGDISTTGKIGIGATAGTSKLEVTGSGATSATSALNVMNSTPSSLLYVRNDGNVGIGTTSPQSPLEITRSTTYLGLALNNTLSTGQTSYLFQKSGASKWQIGMDFAANGTADWYVYDQVNTKAKIYANAGNLNLGANAYSSPAVAILDGGNVGIGTTSPTSQVHVLSSAAGFTGMTVENTGASANPFIRLKSGASRGAVMYFNSNNSDIGSIAVASDIAALQVQGSAGNSLRFYTNGNTGSSAQMSINTSGNVGIGTVSPTEALHVVGNVKATGSLSTTAAGGGQIVMNGSTSGTVTIQTPAVAGTGSTFTLPAGTSGGVVAATLTTTSASSDVVALNGVTASSHCSITANNTSAATNITSTYVSAKAANSVTISHTTIAGMVYDLLCTPN